MNFLDTTVFGIPGVQDFMSSFDPNKAANKYLRQQPDVLHQYYDPYVGYGQQAMGQLQGQYNNLMSDPSGALNQIGQGYQSSPGFNFALQQALQASKQAAAAGGMAGSPQHEQQSMQVASGLASQDYNNWLHNALGLYGQGLSGTQGLANMGYGASNELAQSLSNNLASRAGSAYNAKANNLDMLSGIPSMLQAFYGML